MRWTVLPWLDGMQRCTQYQHQIMSTAPWTLASWRGRWDVSIYNSREVMEVPGVSRRKLVGHPVLNIFPSFDHLYWIRSESHKEASLWQDTHSESVCYCYYSTWRKMINQVKQRGDCVPCHSDCPEAWNKDSRSLQWSRRRFSAHHTCEWFRYLANQSVNIF